MRSLSPEEVHRFLEAASGDRFGIIFAFALATGMRPGEHLALRWQDIDWAAKSVRVERALSYGKNGPYFAEPKTEKSKRIIPLPPSLVRDLKEHGRQQAKERLAAGATYENLDLVFATSLGTPLNERNLLQRHFKPVVKAAGLPETVRLYDLRHTCATLLMLAGENPQVVAERLGHSQISLTLDVYSHVLPTMQQSATDRLERLLYGER